MSEDTQMWFGNDRKERPIRHLIAGNIVEGSAANPLPVKLVQDGWQPIETAPKDGSSVLVYEGFEPIVTEGWWDAEDEMWRPSGSRNYPFWHQPTHWQPLPDPPEPS